MNPERREIVIVGSGPAGVATALSLDKINPELAQKALVVEARRHPREKVCAGCITGRALDLFEQIGIDVTVPNVPVYSARFRTLWGDLLAGDVKYGAVVRRDEFDASAAAKLSQREIELREGVRVQNLSDHGDGIMLHTTMGDIVAKVVVGADGAGSVVRKHIQNIKNTTLLVQAEMETDPDHPAHAENRIEFDFRKVPEGRRGYRWTFPYVLNEKPHLNVGICEWNDGSATDLKERLIRYLDSEGYDHKNARFRFFPERSYKPDGPVAAPRIVLVGEAAGIDPFLGEGLSYSVEYGMLAAEAIDKAFMSNDFSFKGHSIFMKTSRLGMTLRILNLLAKHFYGPLHERLVRNGLMDPQVSSLVGDFLAGRIKPTAGLVVKIALQLARNMLP